jgi:hypothetical protein
MINCRRGAVVVAIDPTTPVTPIIPALPAGAASDSVAVIQALARQAQANATAPLGEIAGRASASPSKACAPVEQAGQAATQDAGHAADAPSAKAASAAAQALAKASPETRLARAVRVAATEAVPRQTGLAPLMANVRAIVDRPDMPIEVREAGKVLLAKTPRAAEIATAQGLRKAVERSGVFLEARMAREAVTPESAVAPRSGELPDIKAALLVFRGALSAWLARATPLGSGGEPPLEPAVEAPAPVEEEASAAPQRLSATPTATSAAPHLRTPPTPEPTTAPATPVQTSERPAVTTASPAPVEPPLAEETQHVVTSSLGLATTTSESESLEARFGSLVAAPKPAPQPAQAVRAALSALVQLGMIAEDATQEEAPAGAAADPKPLVARGYGAPAAEAARPKGPPPPYANGPMAGQKPTASELPVDMSPADIVRRLLKETNGALARQDLMQIASLPEAAHHEAEAVETRPQPGSRLNLDLPFMTPQGVAVAQFEISRDGGGSGGGAVGPAERTYRARFSIDLEPLGPVHALITLTGARTRVSLWAERAETMARLRAGEESLGAALRQAELSPEVAVHSGAPPTPGVSALGHFVDQAS